MRAGPTPWPGCSSSTRGASALARCWPRRRKPAKCSSSGWSVPSTRSNEETGMDTVTRRKFLIRGGVVGAGVLAAGATAYTLQDILKTSGERPSGAKTLVVVTLYGGNDG